MFTQQRSFHIIECPVGVSSSHAYLVVSGYGIPHQTLTEFNEELQKTGSTSTNQDIIQALLSFFTFLEQPGQVACCSTIQSKQLPGCTYWAGPPAHIQAAIRSYLLLRWGCLTRAKRQREEILLSHTVSETAEIQHFLGALQQFYRFALDRHDYWYEGNPAAFFTLPLRSRLWQALSGTLQAHAPRHASSKDAGRKEVPVQSISPATPPKEQAPAVLPAEAWMQLVPDLEPVAAAR